MELLQTLKNERVSALKAGETFRKETLTLILSAVKQVEVDTRKELSEADVIQILTKMVKQRQESISAYMQAGRLDLAEIETLEKNIIQEFLPAQMCADDVLALVKITIEAQGATSIKDMGKVVAALKPNLIGKADMGEVSRMVKELLTS
jgi:uncharacterized protein